MLALILMALFVLPAIHLERQPRCHTETVPIYWADGTESTITLRICQ